MSTTSEHEVTLDGLRKECERLRTLLSEAHQREKDALQVVADLTEKHAADLLERWTSDLGATPDTKAAGVASHLINYIHAEISVMLMKLDRAALERSEG
ncbi:hypothetical protein JZX86_05640 [Agrobacterium rosae]|uniref:hypothetical protein n=1 Tax=Agrobacterium rosae TaxID=1972867 RepID=UPI0019D365F2|nr:hypothetical protein [Agrobacterium rosae]MBN7804845.1 hypothetical protein [Agrobacterium rosae]